MANENNIPAFPVLEKDYDMKDNACLTLSSPGMTLLDYMAAKVCNGICVAEYAKESPMDTKDIAYDSYTIAAAMLEVRKEYIK